MRYSTSNYVLTSVISSPATYVAQLALTARCRARNSRTIADGARQFANRCLHRRTCYRPATPDQRPPTTGTSPCGSEYVIFAAFICKVVRISSSAEAVDDHAASHGHPLWLKSYRQRRSYVERWYILYVDDDWRMEYASQWDAGANALTLAAISCVLYSAVAAPR